MSVIVACIAVSLAVSGFGAEAVADRIQKQFTSDDYTVTWGSAARWESNADLEIGDGAGHGGGLRWMRFRPRQDAVEILGQSTAPDIKVAPNNGDARAPR
jgi:hypothetical protein